MTERIQRGDGWSQHIARVVVGAGLRGTFDIRLHDAANVPRRGALLVVGNHDSAVDGPLVEILGPRPVAFLVKAEAYNRIGEPFLTWAGQIRVNRGSGEKRPLQEALEILGRGGCVGVFPGGTRGADLADAKHGAAWLALRSQAPVLPFAVIGSRAAMPKGHGPRFRAPIDVFFGTPQVVSADAPAGTRTATAAATETIRGRVLDQVERGRAWLAAHPERTRRVRA